MNTEYYSFDLNLHKNGFAGRVAELWIKNGDIGKVYRFNRQDIVLQGDLSLEKGKLPAILDLLIDANIMNDGAWEGQLMIRNEEETKILIAPRFVEQKQLEEEKRSDSIWIIFWWTIAIVFGIIILA